MSDTSDQGGTSGKDLRSTLEATLAENHSMKDELHTLKVEKIISSKGLSIKPADLKGIPLDRLEAEAERINGERLTSNRELAMDRYAAQGLQGQELMNAVEAFVNGTPGTNSAEAAAYARARATGTGGTPPAAFNPEGMSAREKLRAGVEQQSKTRT